MPKIIKSPSGPRKLTPQQRRFARKVSKPPLTSYEFVNMNRCLKKLGLDYYDMIRRLRRASMLLESRKKIKSKLKKETKQWLMNEKTLSGAFRCLEEVVDELFY